jgi:hypothetical protein
MVRRLSPIADGLVFTALLLGAQRTWDFLTVRAQMEAARTQQLPRKNGISGSSIVR